MAGAVTDSLIMFPLSCLVAGLAIYSWVRQARRGPVLAAGVDGVWLRRTTLSARAMFVPWEAVRQVRSVRWGLTQMVYVEVHQGVRWPADGPLGGLTAVVQQIAGRGAAMSVTYSDADLGWLLGGLYQLSAGRVPIR